MEEAAEQTVLKGLVEIAHQAQFFFDVALFHFFLKRAQFGRGSISRFQRFKNGFGGEHSALDGHVNALEPLRIEKAGGIPDDQTAVHIRARHGIPSAGGNRFCAVADQPTAFENSFQEGMRLPNLKGFVRIELRIRVFETDYQADGNAIVREAVDPAAAIHVRGHGPAEGVRNVAGVNAPGLHVPQFLDADAVNLRIDVVELVFLDELFGERAARAFRKDGDLGAQFVSRRVVVLGLAVFVDAFVFGDDAGDALAFVD